MYRNSFLTELENNREYCGREVYLKSCPSIENVEITNVCNMKCRTCVIVEREPTHMEEHEVRKFLDLNRDIVRDKYIWLHVSGEPLMHPKLGKIISMFRKEGAYPRLSTNCMLLYGERAEEILDSGLEEIVFSIDGATEETYNLLRRGGNFGKVVSNALGFLEAKEKRGSKKPITQAQLVRTRVNEHEVGDFIDYWSKTPVNWINIKNASSRLGKIRNPSLVNYKGTHKEYPCLWPWRAVLVLSGGDVVPCCNDMNGYAPMGNAFEKPIADIWNGEPFVAFRKGHVTGKGHEICEGCSDYRGYGESFEEKLRMELEMRDREGEENRIVRGAHMMIKVNE
jgi:MoaA/NifB/PqqE/SkfB family radical SAM enzyme